MGSGLTLKPVPAPVDLPTARKWEGPEGGLLSLLRKEIHPNSLRMKRKSGSRLLIMQFSVLFEGFIGAADVARPPLEAARRRRTSAH